MESISLNNFYITFDLYHHIQNELIFFINISLIAILFQPVINRLRRLLPAYKIPKIKQAIITANLNIQSVRIIH